MIDKIVIQKACDHDWEIFESEGIKQCTYLECQLEKELDAQDYVMVENDEISKKIDELHL